MQPISFAGTYQDGLGLQPITWLIRSSARPGWEGRFEILTNVRGVELWGCDFDGVEPADPKGDSVQRISVNAEGELSDCIVTGDLPCSFLVEGQVQLGAIRFEVDLRPNPAPPPLLPPHYLTLSCVFDGATHNVADEWFEDGLQRLEAKFEKGRRLMACITCLFSDYSPGGHGLLGIRCHRGAKEQYLAVKSKADYWRVPVTEEVPEAYLCAEYERRVPGTGYRG